MAPFVSMISVLYTCLFILFIPLSPPTDKDYNALNQSVCAQLTSSECVEFPGLKIGDVCSFVKPACPIKSGATYNVTIPIPILEVFPPVSPESTSQGSDRWI